MQETPTVQVKEVEALELEGDIIDTTEAGGGLLQLLL